MTREEAMQALAKIIDPENPARFRKLREWTTDGILSEILDMSEEVIAVLFAHKDSKGDSV